MKIDMTSGQPVIDARDLGQLLGLAPRDVQTKMRAGEITSRYETGDGADTGRIRLTFIFGNQRVRLTCADTGDVISTIRLKQGMP